MSNEIEQLKAQKHEIEARLRELEQKEKYVRVGRTKFDYVHYAGVAPDYYRISVECNKFNPYDPQRVLWRGIIRGKTRDDAVAQIPEVIADLQELYNELKGNKDE